MSAALTSEVTQLLYRVAPNLNFAQVIGDLCTAFTQWTGTSPVLRWDCDDIAVLDHGAGRVVVGFCDRLPGSHAACVTIATGQSALAGQAPMARADQLMLCQQVAERLEHRFPSDARQNKSLNEPLTPDLIDKVVDALFQEDTPPAPIRTEAPPSRPEAAAALHAPAGAEPTDMERLMSRLSSELTARTPGLISRAIASATPKGRAAGAPDRAAPATGAATTERPVAEPKAKVISGLFWRKAITPSDPGEGPTDQPAAQAARRSPASELKAVRDALYAQDMTRGGIVGASMGRIAAQTRLALQTLASLPRGIAGQGSAKHRTNAPQIGNRVKH